MTINKLCWAFAVYILVAFVWSQNAKAETNVFVGAWSKHIGSGDYNERHDLVAVEHNNVVAGYFRNSYNEDSFALAYDIDYSYGPLRAGVMAGAVYGYRHCLKGWADSDRKTCPMIAPYASFDMGPVSPTVLLLGNALAVTFRVEL